MKHQNDTVSNLKSNQPTQPTAKTLLIHNRDITIRNRLLKGNAVQLLRLYMMHTLQFPLLLKFPLPTMFAKVLGFATEYYWVWRHGRNEKTEMNDSLRNVREIDSNECLPK